MKTLLNSLIARVFLFSAFSVLIPYILYSIYYTPSVIAPLPTLTSSPAPIEVPLPSKKMLSGGYQTFQTFNNCGPASLSMAISYFGVQISQQKLGNRLRPYQIANGNNDDKSVTFEELAYEAEKLGFKTYHLPNGNFELIKSFIILDLPILTRTLTKPNEDIGHYRVIKGYDNITNELIQDDSLQGKGLRYNVDDFKILWKKFNYEFLVIVPNEKADEVERILSDHKDIEKAWEKVFTESGNNFNRSIALYHLGKFDESVIEFEKVEKGLPSRTLWYQIEPILAYQKVGNYNKAINLIDQIIQNGNRAFSEGYYIKSEIYQSLGQIDKANVELGKVYQYNKNFFKYWD